MRYDPSCKFKLFTLRFLQHEGLKGQKQRAVYTSFLDDFFQEIKNHLNLNYSGSYWVVRRILWDQETFDFTIRDTPEDSLMVISDGLGCINVGLDGSFYLSIPLISICWGRIYPGNWKHKQLLCNLYISSGLLWKTQQKRCLFMEEVAHSLYTMT